MTHDIKGIVIKSIDFEEFDKIITIFSNEMGKISFIARGVNKTTSKNQYSIRKYSYSQYEIFLAMLKDKMSKLKTGKIIKQFDYFNSNYQAQIHANLVCDLVLLNTKDKLQDGFLFKLLFNFFDNIENNHDILLPFIYFLFNFLKYMGNKWDLKKCIICYSKKNIKTFSTIHEGFLCNNCWINQPKNLNIPILNLKLLKFLIRLESKSNLKNLQKNDLNYSHLKYLYQILLNVYNYKIGYSSKYLNTIFKHSIYL